MTESNYFGGLNMKNTCRLCLRTTNNVYAMSSVEINLYRSFVKKISNMDGHLFVCIYCGWTLKKIQKFIDQCQETNDMLNQIVNMESKSLLFLNNMSANLAVSKTEIYDFSPCESVADDNSVKDILCDNYYDDLPLVMLASPCSDLKSKRKKNKKKKHTENSEIKENNIQLKTEGNVVHEEYTRPWNKKVVREGFSSKMVQETSEYVVIKLTREQVLEEMKEKVQSEAFSRAPYKCMECVKGFNFEDVLRNHMQKHTMKIGYLQCDMCTQYCPSAVSLRGHIKSHTTRYKCKLCGHTRLSRQHLLEHHALSHTDAATTYSCDQCSFTSNKRTVIQRHVKSHVPSESHACEQCGKLFKNINSLRVHTIRHDKTKRLRCEQCNKVFIIPSLLQKHVLSVHERKDYYCVECDVKFKTPETMRLHFKRAKRHQDGVSYKCASSQMSVCALCPRTYSSRAALRAHTHRAHHIHKKHQPLFSEELSIQNAIQES